MTLKNLELTAEIRERLRAVQDALAVHRPGVDSAAKIEIPKLDLADAILRAARQQQLDGVPKATPAPAQLPRRRQRA